MIEEVTTEQMATELLNAVSSYVWWVTAAGEDAAVVVAAAAAAAKANILSEAGGQQLENDYFHFLSKYLFVRFFGGR